MEGIPQGLQQQVLTGACFCSIADVIMWCIGSVTMQALIRLTFQFAVQLESSRSLWRHQTWPSTVLLHRIWISYCQCAV